MVALTEPPKLEKQVKHTIEVVVDRLVAKGDDAVAKRRLTDSVETALGLAGGVLVVEFVDLDTEDPDRERRFSEQHGLPQRPPAAMDEVEPRSFSFNSPFGACPECTGIGTELEVDPDLIVPDEDLSLADGAIAPWASGSGAAEYFQRVLAALAEDLRFSMTTPWRALPQRAQEALLHGKNHKVHVRYRNRFGRERSYSTGFEGVIPFVKRRHTETDSDWSRERYEGYMREVPCPVCKGARLKPESLAVLIGGRVHRRRVPRWPSRDAARVPRRRRLHRARAADRRAGHQGDPGPARVPARRRPRLPQPRPAGGHAVRRRGAAHPAGHPDRLRPGRRALRARRAVASGCTSATTTG